MQENLFDKKTILITGGTGSFGNAVLDRFLKTSIKEIRIFSRDEKKQDDMRKKYQSPKLKFYLGDVRDYSSIANSIRGVDFIFHAAALKQVPSCEFYPIEAVKTNVIGTENLLECAIQEGVSKVICLSTDKAVYPINAMGISKALMEKVCVAKSRSSNNTLICATRYGNVLGSRGSVIPLFINQILNKEPITITDPDMTRFMMSLDEAVDLVLYAFMNGNSGDIFVQKSPATTINILVEAILNLYSENNHKITCIGTRHGEKLYEVLCSSEEMLRVIDEGSYFRIPSDNRDLNYSKYFDQGSRDLSSISEYNSHNTEQLTKDQVISLLKKLNFNKMLKD